MVYAGMQVGRRLVNNGLESIRYRVFSARTGKQLVEFVRPTQTYRDEHKNFWMYCFDGSLPGESRWCQIERNQQTGEGTVIAWNEHELSSIPNTGPIPYSTGDPTRIHIPFPALPQSSLVKTTTATVATKPAAIEPPLWTGPET